MVFGNLKLVQIVYKSFLDFLIITSAAVSKISPKLHSLPISKEVAGNHHICCTGLDSIFLVVFFSIS